MTHTLASHAATGLRWEGRRLGSVRWRLFLTAWLVYTVHFATNVVREHYPAFSLIEHGTFRVDRYQGFHPDIFVHRDGHSYIGNNVTTSVFAAVPLLVFRPVLDALERYNQRQIAQHGTPDATYRTPKPNRQKFFELVEEQGLALRFGAATVVTSAFLMAPLSALMVVLVFGVLRERDVPQNRAVWLALLFAFGTPLFFRTAPLNPNCFVMYAAFGSFLLLWRRRNELAPVSVSRRWWAGVLAGLCLAIDYSGIVPLGLLFAYVIGDRMRTASWRTAVTESLGFVAGAVPPVLWLLYTQWAMYGNPFLPGQYWMPAVNYTDRGWRGFAWPAPDLFVKNLFDPRYGLYAFGPLLLIGLIPIRWYRAGGLVLSKPERWFAIAFIGAFLVFCAANQYSRMQWNTGFRYLVPLVPVIFLQASDHLTRMRPGWLALLSGVVVLHQWVLAMGRESVLESWRIVLTEGPQLPWLRVLRLTSPPGAPIVSSPWLPVAIIALTGAAIAGIWYVGSVQSRERTA